MKKQDSCLKLLVAKSLSGPQYLTDHKVKLIVHIKNPNEREDNFSLSYSLELCKEILGAIHSTKIQTGPTVKSGPPQKVDQFFRNFSGWTEAIH